MSKNIIVTFIPQMYTGRKKDICINMGEPRQVDVTKRILTEMSLEEIQGLTSNSYEADYLVNGLCEDHSGPFEVEGVEEAVAGFFGVDDLPEITEELLAEKRAAFMSDQDSSPSTTVKLRLVVDVEYTPHGTPVSELFDLLEELPRFASNRGLLTGGLPAEVESWGHRVEVVA